MSALTMLSRRLFTLRDRLRRHEQAAARTWPL